MEPTIIGAIITTLGAIIVAIIMDINRKKEKKQNIELKNSLSDYKKLELTTDKISNLNALKELEQENLRLTNENAELKIEIKELKNLDSLKIGELVYIPNDLFYKNSSQIKLESFRIDAYPITNFQFQLFVLDSPKWNKTNSPKSKHKNVYYLLDWIDNEYPTGKKNHPVVWINWLAAAAYCNWRSNIENLEICYPNLDSNKDRYFCDENANGFRLPNKNEFEKAAIGGTTFLYPWGDEIDNSNTNYGNHIGDTTYVGKYPPNKVGIYDLCGNVKEWCNDWVDDSEEYKAFKSGSWASDELELRCEIFSWLLPENTNPDFGFRCVKKT